MNSIQKLRNVAEQSVIDLPVPVYVVAKDGEIIKCNSRFAELFGIPANHSKTMNITTFYLNPEDRKKIEQLFLSNDTNEVNNQLIEMKTVDDREICVKDNCRQIIEDNHVIGYLGCLTDITEEEKFREYSPAGIYELDEHHFFKRVNEAAAKSLGYEKNELVGQHVKIVYLDPDEPENIKNELIDTAKRNGKGIIEKRMIRLRAKNHTEKSFWTNVFKMPIEGDTYSGRHGNLIDVTKEEELANFIDQIPIGVYRINYCDDGRQTIDYCNIEFCEMFGFENFNSARGTDVRSLWQDFDRDSPEFERILEQNATTDTLVARVVRFQSIDKTRLFSAEVHGKHILENGKKVKRIGAIRELEQNEVTLMELRDDTGRFLHVYHADISLMIYMVNQLLMLLYEKDSYTTMHHRKTAVSEELRKASSLLLKALSGLINLVGNNQRKIDAFQPGQWERLQEISGNQELVLSMSYDHSITDEIHCIAFKLMDMVGSIKKGILPNAIVKNLNSRIHEVAKLSSAILLSELREHLAEIDVEAKEFHEKIHAWILKSTTNKKFNRIDYLIRKAIEHLGLFPAIRGVDIRQAFRFPGAGMTCDEKDLRMVFFNVIHNAIKYSWTRPGGQNPWVDVILESDKLRQSAIIKVRNYGVPIIRNEIESGSIFQKGKRGGLAQDRGRTGMGTGLAVARDVVKKYSGDINVSSRPAAETNHSKKDTTVPFITTVTIVLPVQQSEDYSDERLKRYC
jgi:PAS domain S-box-containing protein